MTAAQSRFLATDLQNGGGVGWGGTGWVGWCRPGGWVGCGGDGVGWGWVSWDWVKWGWGGVEGVHGREGRGWAGV